MHDAFVATMCIILLMKYVGSPSGKRFSTAFNASSILLEFSKVTSLECGQACLGIGADCVAYFIWRFDNMTTECVLLSNIGTAEGQLFS